MTILMEEHPEVEQSIWLNNIAELVGEGDVSEIEYTLQECVHRLFFPAGSKFNIDILSNYKVRNGNGYYSSKQTGENS